MSDNRVSWIFLGTALLAVAWGVWLKLNEPKPSEPETEWVRTGGKLVEKETLEPFQGVRAIPFEGAPGMVQWEYTYVDGVRQGPAIEYYPSPNKKVKSRSTYVDGVLQGEVVRYHGNGVVMSRGTAVDGLLDGVVSFYQEDGTVLERNVYTQSAPAFEPAVVAEPALEAEIEPEDQGGDPTGHAEAEDADEPPRMLGPDGEPFTGTQVGTFFGGAKAFEHAYLDGRGHGMHQGWEPDGGLEYERPFAEGRKHGTWKHWAEDGALVSESTFQHGLQVGSASSWFAGERVRQQSQFVHGAEHGVRSNHDSDGRKRLETSFDHGIQIARKEWSRRGELLIDESTPLTEGLALTIGPGDEAVTEAVAITKFPEDLDGGLVLGLRYRVSCDDPDPPAGAARPFRISIVQNDSSLGSFDFSGELGGWRVHEWVVNLEEGDRLELEIEAGAGPLQIDFGGIGFEEEPDEAVVPEATGAQE